jgi:hypothetical protein
MLSGCRIYSNFTEVSLAMEVVPLRRARQLFSMLPFDDVEHGDR